jgi:O-antigen/teichoic acid export membrane protein
MGFSKLIYHSFKWRIIYYFTFFLLNIFIARYYQASVSGWFNFVINYFALFILVTGFSLDSAIGYFVSKEKVAPGNISMFILCWSVVAGLAGIPAAIIVADELNVQSAALIAAAIIYIAGFVLSILNQAVFYAKHNFKFPNLIPIVINILLLLILLFSYLLNYNIDIIFFLHLYAILFLIQGFILWLRLNKLFKIIFKIDLVLIKMFFKYSLLVFIGNFIFFLVYRIDYWFVNKYCSDLLLGNYIQVSKIGQAFMIIPASIASVIFVASKDVNIIPKITFLTRALFTGFVLILGVLVLSGNWLFTLVFGNSFDQMYNSFLFLVPGILCLAIVTLYGAYFASVNLVKFNLIGAIIVLIIIIIGNYYLVPVYDIRGAALVSSIGYFFYMAFQIFIFKKLNNITLTELFVLKKEDFFFIKNMLIKGKLKNI